MWAIKLMPLMFMCCTLLVVAAATSTTQANEEVPSESQCRPYVEKALKELETGDSESGSDKNSDGTINFDRREVSLTKDGEEENTEEEVADDTNEVPILKSANGDNSNEDAIVEESDDAYTDYDSSKCKDDSQHKDDKYDGDIQDHQDNEKGDSKVKSSTEVATERDSDEREDGISAENETDYNISSEEDNYDREDKAAENDSKSEEAGADSDTEDNEKSQEHDKNPEEEKIHIDESDESQIKDGSQDKAESQEAGDDDNSKEANDNDVSSTETVAESDESEICSEESKKGGACADNTAEEKTVDEQLSEDSDGEAITIASERSEEEIEAPEEQLLLTGEIPKNLRYRDHINQILRLDEKDSEGEILIEHSAEIILSDLKKLYENSIKPLETIYKYRDLSNRHFGDPEIFSKPLVLFMGPWSGGKSSIVNYLTGLEFTEWSLRTGAEPSPAYFNILMHGKEPEVLDGTQLAADWTFSGLQKFGQGLEERLSGLKHPSKILEKVNIVEIPGILEVRKQVSRVFPFNDACQWFIDRADIIFLVYDPSKLDVGPETEAILDQLKGRETQTRIILNKADTVKPEELMRVQSALIWNISPLMSSAQPPVMYTVSLWSMPYETGAPVRLLQAQERELLQDLRTTIDKRIENKIASARRFAVRVRNHAKMVDCYLTTYYNHKTIFGNKKLIANAIIENPQNYHIYEGLSTLTNISRYDLPDPETYRDFFRLNPLYEFQQLSTTCTYFRGCPITRLDIAIAYDLPELVGKYKKMVETATHQGMPKS